MRNLIGTFCVFAVGAMNHERRVLLRLDAAFQAFDIERFVSHELQRLRAVIADELQRQHPHADQVAAMNTLEAARNHGLNAEQLRALGRPSRDDPVPYSSPPNTTVGTPSPMYFIAAS